MNFFLTKKVAEATAMVTSTLEANLYLNHAKKGSLASKFTGPEHETFVFLTFSELLFLTS